MENQVIDDLWYWYLTGEKRDSFPEDFERDFDSIRRIFRWFPGDPRCFECNVPLAGVSNFILRPFGSRPSSFSPRFCSHCESFARSRQAGAELELSLLFADVRDSSGLAERIGTSQFKELIRRFYKVTSDVLIDHIGMVNRLMGDQVIALFVPRFAGKDHARAAIQAAGDLLRATGHDAPDGPWIPVGVGVHTGLAYVGAVGTPGGVNEIAVLGSAANLAARLSSQAAAGEILVSEQALRSAGIDHDGLETRTLDIKGFSSPVSVSVIPSRQLITYSENY